MTYSHVTPRATLPGGASSSLFPLTDNGTDEGSLLASTATSTIEGMGIGEETVVPSSDSYPSGHHHGHKSNAQLLYESQQTRKEIIAGSVIGGFMFFLLLGLAAWVGWAWWRKKRVEVNKGTEAGFDLQNMEHGHQRVTTSGALDVAQLEHEGRQDQVHRLELRTT